MEADLVRLRRPVAVALAGSYMHDDGRVLLQQGLADDAVERDQVMARDGAHVGHAQVLEEPAGLAQVDDRVAQSAGPLQEERADARDARDVAVEAASRASPLARELDAREVLADRTDRRADAHLVVVEQDEHARLAVTEVVEPFQGEAAHERGIADHHGDVLIAAAHVASQRQALADGDAGAGMPAVHDVVLALRASREATHPAQLAQRVEAIEPSRQQLVGIGLVAGVPDDAVLGAREDAVQRDRQLDDAERAAQVPAGGGHGVDDLAADLGAEGPGLGVADVLEVLRSADVLAV